MKLCVQTKTHWWDHVSHSNLLESLDHRDDWNIKYEALCGFNWPQTRSHKDSQTKAAALWFTSVCVFMFRRCSWRSSRRSPVCRLSAWQPPPTCSRMNWELWHPSRKLQSCSHPNWSSWRPTWSDSSSCCRTDRERREASLTESFRNRYELSAPPEIQRHRKQSVLKM